MVARFSVLLLCLSIVSCAYVQHVDTAQLPPGFYGTLIDNDVGAINEAAWALGSPDRTRGDPVEALRAAVAVEYLAGELNAAPRWAGMSPITKIQMVQARAEMRRALGIKPDAPAQAVVNALILAMWDLEHGATAGAEQVFASPLFIQPPQRTMQVLNDLPTLPAARAATASAELEEFRIG
jgi:hypothetical protein